MQPRRAASVLLLADAVPQFKVLMVKRHSKARFMANAYVFPGGCVDDADTVATQKFNSRTLPLADLRRAALRELNEETGCFLQQNNVQLGPFDGSKEDDAKLQQLVPYAHWITPKQEKYRYDTWFFALEAKNSSAALSLAVRGDPSEIADVKWISPSDALSLHNNESSDVFKLPPPTYLILSHLNTFQSLSHFLESQKRVTLTDIRTVEPTLEFDLEKMALKRMVIDSGVTHLADGCYELPVAGHNVLVSVGVSGTGRPMSRL